MAKPSYYKAQLATVSAAPTNLAPATDLVYQEINRGVSSPNFDVTGEGDADLMLIDGIATHNVQAQCVRNTSTDYDIVQEMTFTSPWNIQPYDWVCGTRWNLVDVTSAGSAHHFKNWEWQKPTCYFSVRAWATAADAIPLAPAEDAVRATTNQLTFGELQTVAGTDSDGEGAILDRVDTGIPHRTGGPVPIRISGRAAGGWVGGGILGMGSADPPRGVLTATGIDSGTYIAWDIQVRYRRAQGGPIPVTVNFIMDEAS